ncbi:YtxH domain-containing protein [Microcella sp.]|uniref:YtxH domain-containing protein n=1 Tax=Microcella sp. TaxID=1913979 RepID=UPI00299F69B7|nr:YtxH domain-containing protein [Microcella sp.]MDX2025486.1 YtxH domain-containing protein [Microcella sp.]
MRGKILFAAGLAVGYVLGTRAGRERYEQLKKTALGFWNDPRVQHRVDQVEDFVKEKAPEVADFVSDGAKKVVDQVTGRASKKPATPASAKPASAAAKKPTTATKKPAASS